MKKEKVKKEKNKKVKINKKGLMIILLGIIICVGAVVSQKFVNNTVSEKPPLEFEVLDESVLTRDIFKEWVETNSIKKGEYTKEDGDFVYAMISYGQTTKPGVGICIEEVNDKRNIEVVYSIIESSDERQVEKYIPKMILKLPNTSGKIIFKQIQSN